MFVNSVNNVPIYGIFQCLRASYFGSSHVSYSQFPLRVGEKIQVLFPLPRRVCSPLRLKAILRYLEERREREYLPGRRVSDGLSLSQQWVTRIYEIDRLSTEISLELGESGGGRTGKSAPGLSDASRVENQSFFSS